MCASRRRRRSWRTEFAQEMRELKRELGAGLDEVAAAFDDGEASEPEPPKTWRENWRERRRRRRARVYAYCGSFHWMWWLPFVVIFAGPQIAHALHLDRVFPALGAALDLAPRLTLAGPFAELLAPLFGGSTLTAFALLAGAAAVAGLAAFVALKTPVRLSLSEKA